MPQTKSFVKATKGKVILALFLACFALFMAWSISKVVFQEMLVTVGEVSAPSERLNLVNIISRKISSLDQQQKRQAIQNPGNYNKLFRESLQLRRLLDSLAALYPGDSIQNARLTTIKTLLIERDKQFLDYLKVRARLVNNQSFSSQVKELNALVSKGADAGDSTILATEERTSTTTFSPEDNKPRSFFGKLFGKKKDEKGESFTIISEQKIKRDTIALSAAEEAIAKNVESSLRNIEQEQRKRNNSFVNREARLANANGVLISQMLEVLTKVENEVVEQIDSNAVRAREVVNSGISRITLVMIVFFLITVVLLWLILTDITRSNRYRRDLEIAKDEAEYHGKAKQRFLANMSHEIRTPLQSIIGYSELLLNEGKYSEPHLRAISQSSEHLLQIVNEVLDYNRIISGKFSFENRPFRMHKLLNEVISVIRPQAVGKSLDLLTKFDLDNLGVLNGDSFRLKQILLNLLGNAIKFTESGSILLSVEHKIKRNQVYFTFIVKDTGVGMSEADSKVVFNEFEQSRPPAKEVSNRDGAGLGLTIVKALVEGQQGRIYLKSQLNKGTTFTVFLAFDLIGELADNEPVNSLVVRRATGTVWVIDDDPLILNLCGVILGSQQISYKSFSSPLAVLQEPRDELVSHILMDMRMPEMDGIALCQELRADKYPDTEILAMTAQVLPSEQGDLLNKGFDGILMKPFKAEDLLNAVSDVMNLNLDALHKITLNDPELIHRIIDGFVADCAEDARLVADSIQQEDWDTVTLVVHRLAGRTGQMGIPELASSFRSIELKLRSDDFNKDLIKVSLKNLLIDLDHVAESFRNSTESPYSIS